MKTSSHTSAPDATLRSWLQRPITIAVIGGLALVAAFLWSRLHSNGLSEFNTYPHAYIAVPGFDVALVVVQPGPLPRPAQIERDGVILWPAYICSDKSLVPEREGQTCIFPLKDINAFPQSPPLPPNGIVLEGKNLKFAQPYLTPEAKAILATFAERVQ